MVYPAAAVAAARHVPASAAAGQDEHTKNGKQ
jgi:hypothetical protein